MSHASARTARRVEDLMKRDFVTVEPGESLLAAERIMRLGRIRHLPVVEKGVLVGMVSHRDVVEASLPRLQQADAEAQLEHLRRVPVSSVMRPNPWTASRDAQLAEVAERMLRLKIGCLPVVEGSETGPRLIGLITESDLLRAAYTPDLVF